MTSSSRKIWFFCSSTAATRRACPPFVYKVIVSVNCHVTSYDGISRAKSYMKKSMHVVRKEDLPLIGSSYNFCRGRTGRCRNLDFPRRGDAWAWCASACSRIRRDRARAGRPVAIRDRRCNSRSGSRGHSRCKSKNSARLCQCRFGSSQAARYPRESAIPAGTCRSNRDVP